MTDLSTTFRSGVVPATFAPPLSSFIGDDGQTVVDLHGGIAGYVRVGRWAVMPGDPLADAGDLEGTVGELLAHLRRQRLRPIVVATEAPDVWERSGMHVTPVANDARVSLDDFTLTGKRMSKVRHAITSAERSGLRIEPYRHDLAEHVTSVSDAWLTTKHGGELQLTLGRLDTERLDSSMCRVAIDESDCVVGFVTWRVYAGGRARVLDLMRRRPDAPNPTMDALIGRCLTEFRDMGLEEASLNAVPLPQGPIAESLYPTASLRSYKHKFNPHWVPQWMATPSGTRRFPASLAVARAYCPDGVTRALLANSRFLSR